MREVKINTVFWENKPNRYEGDIFYHLIRSDVGSLFAAETEKGLCQLSFVLDNNLQIPLGDLEKSWPQAFYHHRAVSALPEQVNIKMLLSGAPVPLHLSATPFQRKVWQALLAIPIGKVTTYGAIAKLLHQPRASQAVGQAVGANPVAVLLPCHRVINANGVLGHYHWGAELKQQLLEIERSGTKKLDEKKTLL